eukprot:1155889-Pelagomonas_calceolata.AAC.2
MACAPVLLVTMPSKSICMRAYLHKRYAWQVPSVFHTGKKKMITSCEVSTTAYALKPLQLPA